MKKTLLLFIILLATTLTYGQAASKVNNGQNINTSVANPPNLLGCEPLPTGTFKPYIKDDLRWETYNVNNLSSYISTIGSGLFKPLSYTPSSAEISTSLGYTPYNGGANPLGFLTSFTETDPLFNSKFSSKTTGDLTEGGGNLYYTTARFNTAFSSKTTTDLVEGLNLYFTAGRFNSNFSSKTTSDLAEGTGLYYTDARSRAALTLTNTGTTGNATYSNLTGVLNIPNYAPTNSQVISALGFNPINPNGTNLQYIAGDGTKITFPSIPAAQIQSDWNQTNNAQTDFIKNKPTIPTNTNQLTNGAGFITGYTETDPLFDTKFAAKTTNGLTEGNTNLYYTDARARNAITLSTTGTSGAATYSGGTLNIPNYAPTNAQVISALGFTPYNSTNPNGYVTQSGARSAISVTTVGTSGASSYNSSTGVLNIPVYTPTAPTYNNAPARTLNSNFTISTTQNSRVSYTIALTTSLSLLNLNSAARVYLEISTNGGTTWQTINSAGTSRTLAVSISVGINETSYWNLVGEVPANALVRLRSVVSGGGTSAWDSGQEVTY